MGMVRTSPPSPSYQTHRARLGGITANRCGHMLPPLLMFRADWTLKTPWRGAPSEGPVDPTSRRAGFLGTCLSHPSLLHTGACIEHHCIPQQSPTSPPREGAALQARTWESSPAPALRHTPA